MRKGADRQFKPKDTSDTLYFDIGQYKNHKTHV